MSFIPRTFQRVNRLATNTRVPTSTTLFTKQCSPCTSIRLVHTSPKEYNGIQTAAYHFKRQRHMPYFLEYLMWVVFGSEALHLIWLKMEYKEYKEKIQHKTKLLEELIERIENGEIIDSGLKEEIRMVLMNKQSHIMSTTDDDIDDDYLDNLIANSEIQKHEKGSVTESKVVKNIQEESKWMDIEKTNNEDSGGDSSDITKKKPFFL